MAARRPSSSRSRSDARRVRLRRHVRGGQRRRGAEPDDPRRVQRPRPQPALVAAAVEERRQAHRRLPCPHVERADALRAMDLVRRDRQQVDAHRVDVERDPAEGLGGVGVEQDAARLREAADRGQRLQHADLVVGGHDADQDRLRLEGRFERREIDQAVAADRQHRHAAAARFEVPARIEHRAMLGRHGHDVVAAPIIAIGGALGHALDRQVVRFGGAAREDDVLVRRADHRGHLASCRVDGVAGPPAGGVIEAGRVADLIAQQRQHRVEHARIDRRGGVGIQVDHVGITAPVPRRARAPPPGSPPP